MTTTNGGYRPLILGLDLLENQRQQAQQNLNEELFNNYKNTSIYPPIKVYKSNENLTPQIMPDYKDSYKNKSIYTGFVDKPSQTENDEIGVNVEALNRLYGYTNYGNHNYKNSDFPESLKHKTQPKNFMYELN